MIVRTWRGYAEASRRHAYPEHFRANVRPGLEAIAGFLGASLLRAISARRSSSSS